MYIDVWRIGVSQPRASLDPPGYQEHSEDNCNMNPIAEYVDDAPIQRNWVIKKSSLGGRGVFASKRIQKGSLIFENRPLVIGPRADCTDTYCIVCYKMCNGTGSKCDKCKLLLCSDQCESSSNHVVLCAFIRNNWKPKLNCERYSEILACALIYVRFILLEDEQKYFLNTLEKIKSSKDGDLEMLGSICVIPEEQFQYMSVVNSIIKVNSFRISNNPQNKTVPLRGLYPLTSFLNHSCVPNTRNIFKKDYTMSIYASKDIEMGEEILTCYTGLLWCTPARRCQLYKTKKFWCKCYRCKDRTEMGTNLSALKCLNKECVGVLLPIFPTDTGTEWSCDNCHSKVDASRISTLQSILGSLVGTLDLDNQFRLESVVLERLAKFIPYTNHIFVDLRLRLALRVGFTGLKLNELSESRLALKESLCRGTLRTVAALGAGDAHLRGLLLYHLHAALAERARRSPDLYDELKSEIENSIEQAYHILQGDISAPPDLELRRQYLGPGCDKPHQERFFILDI